MLLKTEYTLRKDGEDIHIKIQYQHFEATENSPEELQVIATEPHCNFSDEAMEEIELHCWSDLMVLKSKECFEEAYAPYWIPEQIHQEIPQCRKHYF